MAEILFTLVSTLVVFRGVQSDGSQALSGQCLVYSGEPEWFIPVDYALAWCLMDDETDIPKCMASYGYAMFDADCATCISPIDWAESEACQSEDGDCYSSVITAIHANIYVCGLDLADNVAPSVDAGSDDSDSEIVDNTVDIGGDTDDWGDEGDPPSRPIDYDGICTLEDILILGQIAGDFVHVLECVSDGEGVAADCFDSSISGPCSECLGKSLWLDKDCLGACEADKESVTCMECAINIANVAGGKCLSGIGTVEDPQCSSVDAEMYSKEQDDSVVLNCLQQAFNDTKADPVACLSTNGLGGLSEACTQCLLSSGSVYAYSCPVICESTYTDSDSTISAEGGCYPDPTCEESQTVLDTVYTDYCFDPYGKSASSHVVSDTGQPPCSLTEISNFGDNSNLDMCLSSITDETLSVDSISACIDLLADRNSTCTDCLVNSLAAYYNCTATCRDGGLDSAECTACLSSSQTNTAASCLYLGYPMYTSAGSELEKSTDVTTTASPGKSALLTSSSSCILLFVACIILAL